MTAFRCAPIAMRMPISRDRCSTGVQQDAVEPDTRQDQSEDAKERRQHGYEAFLKERLVDLLTDRRDRGDKATRYRGAHVISQMGDNTLSVDCAADDHRDAGDAIERLCDRQVDHRLSRLAQALVP